MTCEMMQFICVAARNWMLRIPKEQVRKMAMSATSSDLPRPCDSPGHDSQGPSDPNSTGMYLSQKSAQYNDVGAT